MREIIKLFPDNFVIFQKFFYPLKIEGKSRFSHNKGRTGKIHPQTTDAPRTWFKIETENFFKNLIDKIMKIWFNKYI
jgi:hypothetical protein